MKLPVAKPLSVEEYIQSMDNHSSEEVDPLSPGNDTRHKNGSTYFQQPIIDKPERENVTPTNMNTLSSQSNVNVSSNSGSRSNSTSCIQMLQPVPITVRTQIQPVMTIPCSNSVGTFVLFNNTTTGEMSKSLNASNVSQGTVLTNQDILKPILPAPNARVPVFNYTPFVFSSFSDVVVAAAAKCTQETKDTTANHSNNNNDSLPQVGNVCDPVQNTPAVPELNHTTTEPLSSTEHGYNEKRVSIKDLTKAINDKNVPLSDSVVQDRDTDIRQHTLETVGGSQTDHTKVTDNLTDTINRVAAGEGFLRQRFTPKAKRRKLTCSNEITKGANMGKSNGNKRSGYNLSAAFASLKRKENKNENRPSTSAKNHNIENHYLLNAPSTDDMTCNFPDTSPHFDVNHYLLQTPTKKNKEHIPKFNSEKAFVIQKEKAALNVTNMDTGRKSLPENGHSDKTIKCDDKCLNNDIKKSSLCHHQNDTHTNLLEHVDKEQISYATERSITDTQKDGLSSKTSIRKTYQNNAMNIDDDSKVIPSIMSHGIQMVQNKQNPEIEHVLNSLPKQESLNTSSKVKKNKQLLNKATVVLEKLECATQEETVRLRPVQLVSLPKKSSDKVKENPNSPSQDWKRNQQADARLKKVVYIVDSQTLAKAKNKKVDKPYSPRQTKETTEKTNSNDKNVSFAIKQKKPDLYVVPKLNKNNHDIEPSTTVKYAPLELNDVTDPEYKDNQVNIYGNENNVDGDKLNKSVNKEIPKDHISIMPTSSTPQKQSYTVSSLKKSLTSHRHTVAALLKSKRQGSECADNQKPSYQSKKQYDAQPSIGTRTNYPSKYIGLQIQSGSPGESIPLYKISNLQMKTGVASKADTQPSTKCTHFTSGPPITASNDIVNTIVSQAKPVLSIHSSTQPPTAACNTMLQSGPISLKIANKIFVVKPNSVTKDHRTEIKTKLPAPRPKSSLGGKRRAEVLDKNCQIKKKVKRVIKKRKEPLDKLIESLKLLPAHKKMKRMKKMIKQKNNLIFSSDSHAANGPVIEKLCSKLTPDYQLTDEVRTHKNDASSLEPANEITPDSATNTQPPQSKYSADGQCTKMAITMIITKSFEGRYSYSINKTKLQYMAKKHFEYRRWFKYSDYPCTFHFGPRRRLERLDVETIKPGLYLIAGATHRIDCLDPQTSSLMSAVLSLYPHNVAMLPRNSEAIVIGHIKSIHDTREFPNVNTVGDVESMLNVILGPKAIQNNAAFDDERYKSISDVNESTKCHSSSCYTQTDHSSFSDEDIPENQFECDSKATHPFSATTGKNEPLENSSLIKFSERAMALKIKQNKLLESCKKLKQHKLTSE